MGNKNGALTGRYGFLIIALVGALVYGNIFDAPFVFDDTICIVNNPDITDLGRPDRIYAYTPTRFLTMLSFAVNYAVGGLEVWGYHLVNLVFHLATAMALYLFLLTLAKTEAAGSLFEGGHVALLGALVFVVHPIQTQAVTYTWQRSVVMAALAAFLALTLYVRMRLAYAGGDLKVARRFQLGTLAVLIAGMFCKEVAFTIPCAMLLMEGTVLRKTARPPLGWLLPFGLTLLLIPAIVLKQQEHYAEVIPSEMQGYAAISPLTYLFTQVKVTVTYLRLLVWPLHQQVDYQYPLAQGFLSVLPYLMVLCPLFLLMGWAYRRKPLLAFGLGFFFLALSIEALAFTLPDVIFEHRLYMGTAVAGTVFAAILLRFLPGGKPAFWGLGLVVLAVLGQLTWQRNQLWRDPIVLWSDNLKYAPDKARVWASRSLAYRKQETWGKALADADKAASLDPNYRMPIVTRALVLAEMGRHQEALAAYDRALEMVGNDTDMLNARGISRMRLHQFRAAHGDFAASLELKPGQAQAHNYRGVAASELGDNDAALADFERALALNPSYHEVLINRAAVHRKLGRVEQAMADYAAYLAVNTDKPEVFTTLAKLTFERGDSAEALDLLDRAVRLFPEHTKALYNRGILYYQTQRMEAAAEDFAAVLRINKDRDAFFGHGLALLALGDLSGAKAAFEQARQMGKTIPDDIRRQLSQ